MPAVFGDEFTVNVEGLGGQYEPEMVELPDGRVLITWYGEVLDGSSFGIIARVGTVQPDGSIAWGAASEFVVNSVTFSTQQRPDVAVLPDGRVVFTWQSYQADGSGDGIAGRIGTVQANGSITWGAAGEFVANGEVESTQLSARVTALSDGRIVMMWRSLDPQIDGSNTGIGARIGTPQPDGSVVWGAAGEFVVNEEITGHQYGIQVIELPDGRLMYTWSSADVDVDGNAEGISVRIGTPQANGSMSWAAAGEVTVNEEVQSYQTSPQVTLLADGRVLFTWTSNDSDVDGSSTGIAARVGTVQADGSLVWGAAGEFTVNEEVNSEQSLPQVTVLDDGRVVFVWQSMDADVDGSGTGISARVGTVQADGSIVWEAEGEFTVNERTFDYQQWPQVQVLADGRILFTWQTQDDVDGSATAVVGRVLLLFNEFAIAQDDGFSISETGAINGADLFANNGAGVDSDPDDDAFTVTAVNGSALNVGTQIALTYGALTVNANGTFDYDPNAELGILYADSIVETFTYTIDDGFGGTDTATVSITLNSAGESFVGTTEPDNYTGTAFGDLMTGDIRGDFLSAEAGNDQVFGGAGDDTLYGGSGDDVLDGVLDADQMHGGSGEDTLYGRSGNDTLFGDTENDMLYGADGNDLVSGGDGADLIDGGNHNDTLNGGAGNDEVYGRQNDDVLYGLGESDTLYGGDGEDDLYGGEGGDTLDGGNQLDILYGDAGDDTLYGRQDNDLLYGGGDNDDLYGGDGADNLNGGDGDDLAEGGAGNDTLAGDAGADTLYGRQDNDTLSGGGDNDALYGGDGDDALSGGDNTDTLEGGNGADRLNGGFEADTLWGGTGADTYVFDTALGAGNVDTIQYFSVAEDFIELSTLIFGSLSGDFFVIGAAATSADHRIIYDATTGALSFDADGDGAGAAVQFATLSTGLTGLSESNFLGGP